MKIKKKKNKYLDLIPQLSVMWIGQWLEHRSWRFDPWLPRLVSETWKVTSLVGKKPELVHGVETYWLDITGLTSKDSCFWNQSVRDRLDSVPQWSCPWSEMVRSSGYICTCTELHPVHWKCRYNHNNMLGGGVSPWMTRLFSVPFGLLFARLRKVTVQP